MLTPTATQRLRDMIDGLASGQTGFDELHNELSTVEVTLGLPITEPSALEIR